MQEVYHMKQRITALEGSKVNAPNYVQSAAREETPDYSGELHSKFVLIMYPDNRTTGGLALQGMEKSPSILINQFRGTTTKLLDRYHRQGYENLAVVYKDTSPLTSSPFYPFDRFDKVVSANHALKEWSRKTHPEDLKNLIKQQSFPEGSSFIVGGYHARDCVVEAVRALKNLGYSAAPNLLLTNVLGEFLLMSHHARRILGKLYTDEDRRWDRILYYKIKKEIETLGLIG